MRAVAADIDLSIQQLESQLRSTTLHCLADKSVTCEMDRERNIGSVRCTQCSASFAVKIHALSEPIDVYRCVCVS